jgi:hypothetical protein
MLHARWRTPNRWRRYVAQVLADKIDASEYRAKGSVASLESAFMAKQNIADVGMPNDALEYFRPLPMETYQGSPKVAPLRVADIETGSIEEVPDWTFYGENLERISATERAVLENQGIEVNRFLSGGIHLARKKTGERRYVKLYMPPRTRKLRGG